MYNSHHERALSQNREPFLSHCPGRGLGYVSVEPGLGNALVVVGLKNLRRKDLSCVMKVK